MRTKSRIVFHMNSKETEKLFASLDISAKVDYSDTMQVVSLFTDTEQYVKLVDALNASKIDFNDWKETVYSQKELDSAEFLKVIPVAYCGYPQPEDEYEEVSYNIQSSCPKCFNGMLQSAPIQLLKPKMGTNDIAAIYWIEEFVISNKLKKLLDQGQFSGCEFWPILDPKKKTARDGVQQLFITGQMPPMNSKTNIIKAPDVKQCDCKKKGYMLKDIPIYDRESLQNINDFNKTYEWLGGGESTWQLPIVTKRVYDLFTKNKIKGVRFEPVKIVD